MSETFALVPGADEDRFAVLVTDRALWIDHLGHTTLTPVYMADTQTGVAVHEYKVRTRVNERPHKVLARAVCDYQISTFDNPVGVITSLLFPEVGDHLESFTVGEAYPLAGVAGLCLVQFTVDVAVDHDTDVQQAQEDIETMLNGVIGDSDVSVRALTILDGMGQ